MRDVAALAGVGLATVSRVVNGKPGVTPDLVERVSAASRKLGYQHDLTASSLRRADRKTGSIGMVVEDVANPFSAALFRAVEDVAAQRGVLLLIGSADEQLARERQLVRSLTARRVDGLLVVTGRISDELVDAQQRGIAIVTVDRRTDLDGIDSVTVANRDGVRDAVHRLYRNGHRHIAYLGDRTDIWTATERHAGFIEGLATEGCRLDNRLIRQDLHTEDAATRAANELLTLDHPPTAIISGQNLVTIGTRRALQTLHLEHQIAHIGFDDFPLADLLGVSVISQNPAHIGHTAAERLFTRISGDHDPAEHLVIPTRYIARGSGEIAPSEDTKRHPRRTESKQSKGGQPAKQTR